MRSGFYYQYYVEGDDEKKLLEILKRDFRCIKSGKIDKFNVIQNEFSTARIRTLKPDTVIIFVYDTDVDKPETLQKNIPSVNKGPLGFAPQICDSAALLSIGVLDVRRLTLTPPAAKIRYLGRVSPCSLRVTLLKKQTSIQDVICIPQVNNLEDELLRACQIKNIRQLTHSTSTTDFKRDLISCSNLHTRLAKCGFDISKFWSRIPTNKFRVFGNNASFIKL